MEGQEWEQVIEFCLNTDKAYALRLQVVVHCLDRIKRHNDIRISLNTYDRLAFAVVHTYYYPLQSALFDMLVVLLEKEKDFHPENILKGFPPILCHTLLNEYPNVRNLNKCMLIIYECDCSILEWPSVMQFCA